jgi:hypothetical protein
MAPPVSTLAPDVAAPRFGRSLRAAVLWGGGGFGALLLLAAAGLWFRYGSAVFFETIAAGFANCF